MSLTITTALALVPEPIKLSILAGLGWLGKSTFDWLKSRGQEKRDNFKTISDTLFAEMDRLSKRVDQAEKETKDCEDRYLDLISKYNELVLKYADMLATNTSLSHELQVLRQRIETYEAKEKTFLHND